MRLKEINNLSSDERAKKLVELRTELSRLRTMISAGGAVENPSRVGEIRKTIARVLTIENEYAKGIRKVEGKETKKAAEPKKPKAAQPKKPKETKPE
jgi:large subunit ribosomal protein L29